MSLAEVIACLSNNEKFPIDAASEIIKKQGLLIDNPEFDRGFQAILTYFSDVTRSVMEDDEDNLALVGELKEMISDLKPLKIDHPDKIKGINQLGRGIQVFAKEIVYKIFIQAADNPTASKLLTVSAAALATMVRECVEEKVLSDGCLLVSTHFTEAVSRLRQESAAHAVDLIARTRKKIDKLALFLENPIAGKINKNPMLCRTMAMTGEEGRLFLVKEILKGCSPHRKLPERW